MSKGLARLLAEAMDDGDKKGASASQKSPEELRAMFDKLSENHDFCPGDVIVWKENMRNKTLPEYGQPVVVTQVKPGHVSPNEESGSCYYREPIDLVIGTIDEDGELREWYVDSRRFEPYNP
jgi:hypothetical protein